MWTRASTTAALTWLAMGLWACPNLNAPRAPDSTPKTCEGAPSWLKADKCQSGGKVFQSIAERDPGTLHVAWSRLVDRAVAIGGAGGPRSVAIEFEDTHRCGGTLYGLVRRDFRADSDEGTKSCSAAVLSERAPSASCPDWTRRPGWLVGDTFHAVAMVPAQDRSLTIEDAARSAYGFGALLFSMAPPEGDDLRFESIECGGYAYALVTGPWRASR